MSMGLSRQEYSGGLPCRSPRDLLTQGSNLGLLHCRWILYHLSHHESCIIQKIIAQRSNAGESKLAKMVCSGSLIPRFVNNDCVTAEIVYSTAHLVTRYLPGHTVGSGTRGKRPCCVRLCCGCCCGCCIRASRKAVLRLPCQPGENKHVCSSYSSSSLLPASQLTPCLLWVQ